MPSAALVVASTSLAIWLYLAFARGNFWRLQDFNDDAANHEPPASWPNVVAIAPARNEAATIAQAVTSLLQQKYAGEFAVILVDDHSEDSTAEIARQAARSLQAESRITFVEASSLPAGWTGKLWAMNEGVRSLAENPPSEPTYYWFTDADITHAPDTVRRLVSRAERDHLDLTSLMVLLQAKSFPERLLIPPFLFFFLKLYPPTWIADPGKPTAGAAGGCVLLRRQALDRIGGLSAVRQEIIDDCALARAIKLPPKPGAEANNCHPEGQHSAGPKDLNESSLQSPEEMHGGSIRKIWMGLTRASISLRTYTTLSEIRDLIARTAFTQLRYSPLLLLGMLLAMFLTYIAPVALLFAPIPSARIPAAITWLLMSLLYLPAIRFYRLSPAWAATLPVAALFYSFATLLSALRFWLGRGAQWKGRSQASL